jgi:hypothetical protein
MARIFPKKEPRVVIIGPSGKSRKLSRRREALRDALWPDAATQVWSRHEGKGFTTIPRVLPLIMRLATELSQKGDPSRVYMDLWARAFDEGLITVHDEEDMAYSAGYSGPRAVRTWREHLQTLEQVGFIRTKEQGNREIAHILLLDPLKVAVKLNAKGKVPSAWWTALVTRCSEIGAQIDASELSEDVALA